MHSLDTENEQLRRVRKAIANRRERAGQGGNEVGHCAGPLRSECLDSTPAACTNSGTKEDPLVQQG
jgi:hypothetical protein